MAYLSMTQDVIKFMNSSFDKEDLTSYQMLLVLFSKLFIEEEEFLKDRSDRMGLSHYVENFLRQNDFQTIVTIKDLNMIFNNSQPYDITDKELYKVFFVLIYEELSSNDPQISFKIKEAIFTLINQLQEMIGAPEEEEIKQEVETQVESVPVFNSSPINNLSITTPIVEEPINPRNKENVENYNIQFEAPSQPINLISIDNEFAGKASTFVIHNKKYLHEFIQRKKLMPYRCSICGLSEWQNEPLMLELDSLNGVYNSTELNNLRFLCPNCYSQVGHGE